MSRAASALRRAAPYLAYSYMTLVGRTSSVRRLGLEHFEAARAGGGFIYAFWHQRQVLLTYTHRGSGAQVLVSRSRDREVIAEAMRLSGIGAVRGSSSRGAAPAARELLELLSRGRVVGITPDGPRGPARRVKPGVLFLAQKSGRPILPIASASSRRLEFSRSWDRFQVPLPFSRLCVTHSPPIFVRPDDDIEAKAAELKASLDRATAQADSAVGRADA